jgi:hypothetical protein
VPTYSRDVAPILDRHCISCHSESNVAPFSLVGYANARAYAPTVVKVTAANIMPPWKANPNYGEFRDVPLLSAAEKATLAKWVAAGAPEGNPSDAPPAPKTTAGWRLGKPDLIIAPAKPTKIPAEGGDFYRDYLIDPHVTQPTWVEAIDFRPLGRATVHHVAPQLLAKDEAEKCRKIKFDFDDDSWKQESLAPITRYGSLGFWSTGAPPFVSPEDTALLIKPGDCILLDLHYKTTGKPEAEQTQVGLYFRKTPPKEEMQANVIEADDSIYVQPGDKQARFYLIGPKFKTARTIYAVWPHMHYLGRTFKAWVKFPSGYSKPLVCIDDWDPDWQLLYYLKKPLELPAGSKIYVTGTYDNSKENPRNPHSPPSVVESGPSSKDEMLFFEWFEVVKEKPTKEK